MTEDMGKKLREQRVKCNLTQRDVANAVGVTEATVSRWESGHIDNMRRDKIADLARVLRVSPLFIMGIDNEPPAPPAEEPRRKGVNLSQREERHLELYRALDDEGRAVVDSVTEACALRARDTKTSSGSDDTAKRA